MAIEGTALEIIMLRDTGEQDFETSFLHDAILRETFLATPLHASFT